MVRVALDDLLGGFSRFDVACSLAWSDLKARFERTLLGPLWVVVSNIMLVAGITVVFGALFNNPIREYVVYVSLGISIWTFLSTVTAESPNYLEMGRDIMFTYNLPWSLQILRRILVQIYILLIHMGVFLVVALIAGVNFTPIALLSGVGLLVCIVFAYGLALGFSSLGVRYRDLAHAIASVMVFLFLFTPVFWTVSSLGESRMSVALFNPVYHLIEIVRAPIIAPGTAGLSWIVACCSTAASLIWGVLVYASRRRDLAAWMQ